MEDQSASTSGANEEVSCIEESDIIPGFKTIDDFIKAGYRAVVETTKAANKLPFGDDWNFYTSYPSFHRLMGAKGNSVLQLMTLMLRYQGVRGNIMRRDLEEKFDLLLDASDMILERVSTNLDEVAGIRRNPEPLIVEAVSNDRAVSGSWNKQFTEDRERSKRSPQVVKLLAAKNILRPQLKFKEKVDNTRSPFKPKIKEKPNALTPLSLVLEVSDVGESYNHPYTNELEKFEPSEEQVKEVEPQLYKDLDSTPLIIVERPEDVSIMMADLETQKEIAVDLEHHSYRTYQGITCLMQISTRETDYIVDTIELRNDLQCLNKVFTDPSVVKVFHGAESDIEWLQRDLGLYVVNMFDTHQASRLLEFSRFSLAYIMKLYCNVDANKVFQLADWRIRPLPQEMINYAREDTHYLLYIYERLKKDLYAKAHGLPTLVQSAFQRSKHICAITYQKPILMENSHMKLYTRSKKHFNSRQMRALRDLYHWRDKLARQEDESIGYILPNHMMLQIAATLPREMQGILACCNPIPPLVRQNLLVIHQIILRARDLPLVVVDSEEVTLIRAEESQVKVNLEGALHCPHDIAHMKDYREDLPTLLYPSNNKDVGSNTGEVQEKRQPSIPLSKASAAFHHEDEDPLVTEAVAKIKQVTFHSPFERYKLVKPFVKKMEHENALKEEITDEERVQKLKDHFTNLNATIPQKNPQNPQENIDNHIEAPEAGKDHSNDQKMKKENDVECVPIRQVNSKKKKRERQETSSVEVPNDEPCDDESQGEKRNEKPPAKKARKADVESDLSVSADYQPAQKKTKFTPYNYGEVDFSRFQGGSKNAMKRHNLVMEDKAKKGKKKRITCKGSEKSFTYSKGRR